MGYQKTLSDDQIKLFEVKIIILLTVTGVVNAVAFLFFLLSATVAALRMPAAAAAILLLIFGNILISMWVSNLFHDTFWRSFK